jgi:hypothetical protein
MTRRIAMAMAVMLVCGCARTKAPETLGYDDLPNPPIELVHALKSGEMGITDVTGAHGVVDIHLSESDPIYEIWNDPQTRQDPWGTILLERVDPDGTVFARVREKELWAKVGKPFPGTGIVVVQADPEMQSVVLRSKWTLTEKREEPKSPS